MKKTSWLVICVLLALLPVTIWLVTTSWHDAKLADITRDGRNKLELYRSNLQGAIKEHEYLPITLAADKRIMDLARYGDPTIAAQVNVYLEKLATDSGASDIYFMNQRGMTLAASNWNTQTSFVGRNFAFRPYFQQAKNGLTGHYFALGIRTNVPGYYISHPVRLNATNFAGAMVVKTNLDKLVHRWTQGSESLLVTDQNGIVIIASNPDWMFHALSSLDIKDRPRLIASRKYGNHPLDPMPLLEGEWPHGDGIATIILGAILQDTVSAENRDDMAPTEYLVTGSTLPDQGWRVYLLSEKSVLDRSVVIAGAMGGAAHIILTGLIFIVLQRRHAMLEQLEIRDWSHKELERQVKARTTDLMTTNQRLAEEISERSRTEEALRTAQSDLVQTSKLAALGQMSAGIAKEINHPLSAIRNYAENALQFIARGNNETANRNLQRICELTERMARITDNLNTFSHRPEPDIYPVDVPAQMQKAIDLALDTGRAGAGNITLHQDGEIKPAMAEPNQLAQVFTHLINNAADACQTISTPQIDIRISGRDDRVIVKVNDNGHGILPENLPKLFDPFFTTKPFGDGLGLGLSICYGTIKSFGGTIRAENRPDGGASFIIALRRDGLAETANKNSISTPADTPAKTPWKTSVPLGENQDQG